MSAPAGLGARQRELLIEAAEWRLLGLLFECPSEDWRRQVRMLAAETPPGLLRDAAEAALEEATEGRFHSTFGPGGPAPAREVACTRSVELGGLMAELAAYYEAFGYQPATTEPPDHVSVEAGFMGYLRLKEAYALACEDAERAAVAAEAAERFLSEHIRLWAALLAAALRSSGVRYLELAAKELVRRAGSAEALAPATLPVLEDQFECGPDR